MPVYLFPLKERCVLVGPPPHLAQTQFFLRDVEVICYHNNMEIITAGMIGDEPFSTRKIVYRLEADDPEDALMCLEVTCQLQATEENTFSRAIWLDTGNGRLIEELPECGLRNVNEEVEYICGPLDSSDPMQVGIGEYGMCIIDGHYPGPLKFLCPVRKFKQIMQVKKRRGRLPIEIISGYPFVRASQVLAPRRWG